MVWAHRPPLRGQRPAGLFLPAHGGMTPGHALPIFGLLRGQDRQNT